MATVKCSKCAYLNESGAMRCRRCGTALPSISFEEKEAEPPRPAGAGQADSFQFKRGQVVNSRYTVLDMIGRGGMGCIYKVHDNVLGEDLALKTLLPQFVAEKTVVDRFLNEARITRKLTHPNIVRVHDIGTAGKGVFISMEYVQGDSLRAMLEKRPPGERIPVRQVLHIIDQLCLALDYAHQYTIHRDIKPENIMVTDGNQIKLMDFGISKLMDNRFVTSASVIMGTPFYMSPEQHRNTRDVDARADIYSVGVVMYEMLTGNIPTGVPKPASQILKEVPPALDDILARCIDPNREKRFKTAGELRQAIRPIIEILDQGKDPQKTLAKRHLSQRGRPPFSLRSFMQGIAALLVMGVGVFGLYAVEQMNTAGNVVETGTAGMLQSGKGERFAEVESLVRAFQKAVGAMEDLDQRQQQWLDRGNELWEQARTAAAGGDAAAVTTAENALQHFMGVIMNPEGMVLVPGGYVEVDGFTRYEPGFFMDAAEVTVRQFAEFSKQVEGGWKIAPELRDALDAYPEHPVSYVAWFDAQAFAAWKGRQLPSRNQWARAAHGDTGASPLYPWGAELKADAANIQSGFSKPVRSFNEDLVWSGCYDMAGNVAEWTGTPYSVNAPGAAPNFGDLIYVCGGSFSRAQPLNTPDKQVFEARMPDIGFRCALAVPLSPEFAAALLQGAV